MDGRVSTVVVAAAVMICGAFVTDGSGAQASKNRPVVAGCPSVSAKFHPCALAKARSFNPSRTLNGEPDLTGLWDAPLAQGFQNVEDFSGDPSPVGFGPAVTMIVDPPDGRVPYHPWARVQRDENTAQYVDPYAQCLPTGVPRQMGNFRTRQIVQRPGLIAIVNEAGGHVYRVVYTDGRPHVPSAIRLWMGDSRGRWDGNTLVIETSNMNGRWWYDSNGHFASASLRVVERLTMVDINTIHYQATMEDPAVYTRPWTMVFPLERMKDPGYEQMEEACHEGNRDAIGLLLGGYRPYLGPRFPR
jgi:hypothetical protein